MTAHQELSGQLGRYVIVRKLGAGGMGAVYLAEDSQLGRKVALKVPHFTADAGSAVVERFRREARLAASIEHPNLCPVHDVGEVGGILFFTMPYIEGMVLSHLIEEEKPWPALKAVELVRKIAGAVAHLHQHGIVHRDLKPSNIMVRASGEPVLMDFGLARSFTSATQRLTTTGTPLGSPAYMAPEQVTGARETGPATDVYGLGVILYELLASHLPFEGPLAALFAQILHTPPAAPSSFCPGLDGRLDALCLKALSKKPEERQASVEILAAELASFADQQAYPVATPIPTLGPAPRAVVTQPIDPFPPTVPPGQVETREPPRIPCPKCGKFLRVPETIAGRKVKCPKCGASMGRLPSARETAPVRDDTLGGGKQSHDRQIPNPEQTKKDIACEPIPKPPDPIASLRLVVSDPVTLEAGQSCKIVVGVTRERCPGPIQLRLALPSSGITARNGLIWADDSEGFVELAADAEASPGVRTITLLAIGGAARSEVDVKVTLRSGRLARELKNSLDMKMVLIPKGRFQMGSPEGDKDASAAEFPQHEMEISRDFHITTTKVTVGQFRKFVKDDGYQSEAERDGKGGYGFDPKTGKFVSGPEYTWKNPGWEQTDEHPVVNVTWNDAVKFCEWLSRKEQKVYDLPTEAEWEYACRAGSTEAYCFGKDVARLADYAWYNDNAGKNGAQPVGKKKANDWGLYDMHGNAWEWCLDDTRTYQKGYIKDPVGDVKGDRRVLRGGSWNRVARYCRSAYRGSGGARDHRDAVVGFRVVLRTP